MVTHGGKLAGLVVLRVCGIVDGFGRPDAHIAIFEGEEGSAGDRKAVGGGVIELNIPPAAVTRRWPSGET